MCKVVDLFSRKELKVEDLVPTPEEELLSIMGDVIHSLQYHKVMALYASHLKNIIEEIDKTCSDSSKLTWADLTPILDGFENLIDISKPDHKAVIDNIFEGSNGLDSIKDPILRNILKRNAK